jgi:hypothetical protein
VLMYFAPEQMRLAIERIARSLAPGGFLFLGHAETLRGVSDAFHLRHTHGTFYYQLMEHIGPATPSVSGFEMQPESLRPPVTVFDETWIDTIRAATDRVAALVPLAPAGRRSPGIQPRRSIFFARSASRTRSPICAAGRWNPTVIQTRYCWRRRYSRTPVNSPRPRSPAGA